MSTVKQHLHQIYRALGVRSRAEAIAQALNKALNGQAGEGAP